MKADKEFLRNAVAEIIDTEPEKIGDDTNFVTELEVDSVQMLEIVATIEEEYDIEAKASDLSKYDTINKIAELLEQM